MHSVLKICMKRRRDLNWLVYNRCGRAHLTRSMHVVGYLEEQVRCRQSKDRFAREYILNFISGQTSENL